MTNTKKKLQVFPKPDASRRTKTRIKQNGLDKLCFLRQGVTPCQVMNGVDCIFVESETGNWLGWLPVNEINIENPRKVDD